MNLHEYQAKKILDEYGIPITPFAVASNVEEAMEAQKHLQCEELVLKVQIHAGGRGKAGGIRFVKSKKELQEAASQLIGMKIVNQQTGPSGVICHKIMITKPVKIVKEYYISALIDRDQGIPVLIASPEGGMDIEEVAHKYPDRILKIPFSFEGKIRAYQGVRLAKFMGWQGAIQKQGIQIARQLTRCFIEKDASLLEINPLVLTKHEGLIALDAKLSIDDNALFRQKEIADCYDPSQVSKQEALAKEYDLAYIAMEGSIGCMVNGAGLAMATMDMIQLAGGSPANFLDVGGSASEDKIGEGFRIILSDPKVKAILVNIFGGIMNCETLAKGVIRAAKEMNSQVPMIVRMEGTNVDLGKKLFHESHLKIQTAEDLEKAAQLAVAASKRS
jgi:succinyl-CoA synthetase beta subunit